MKLPQEVALLLMFFVGGVKNNYEVNYVSFIIALKLINQ